MMRTLDNAVCEVMMVVVVVETALIMKRKVEWCVWRNDCSLLLVQRQRNFLDSPDEKKDH